MTPQMRNDYPNFPEHPRPESMRGLMEVGDDMRRRMGHSLPPKTYGVAPGGPWIFLAIAGSSLAIGLGIGAIGLLAPKPDVRSDVSFDEGYRAGVKAGFQLGTVCAKSPTLEACNDAELIRQGVL